MNNPIVPGPYSFNANLSVLNYIYGLTTLDNMTIYDGTSGKIESL
jgi:hypothetical protein